MRTYIAAAAVLLPLTVTAQQILPSDADLKSAYCIAVIKKQIVFMNEILGGEPPSSPAYEYARKMLRQRNNDLNRLQSYLLPKLSSLDATGLIAASRRAETDVEESGITAKQCTGRCDTTLESGRPGEKWSACIDTCLAENGAATRVNSCKAVNWLPF
jgi:hypothetical protein